MAIPILGLDTTQSLIALRQFVAGLAASDLHSIYFHQDEVDVALFESMKAGPGYFTRWPFAAAPFGASAGRLRSL